MFVDDPTIERHRVNQWHRTFFLSLAAIAGCGEQERVIAPPNFVLQPCPFEDPREDVGAVVLPESLNVRVVVNGDRNQDNEPGLSSLYLTAPEERLLLGPLGSIENNWVILGPYPGGTTLAFRPDWSGFGGIHCGTFFDGEIETIGRQFRKWSVEYNLRSYRDFVFSIEEVETYVGISAPLWNGPLTVPASGQLTLEVGVFATGFFGALPNRTVTLSLAREDGATGTLSQTVVETGPTGLATVTFTAPPASGAIMLRGTSPVSLPRERTITVQGAAATELRLTCEPASVVRGMTVSCTASTEPPGAALRVTEWKFEPEAVTGLPAVTITDDVRTWTGPLAVGGTVTVAALVDEQARTASQALTVHPRVWMDKVLDPRVNDVGSGNLPDPPTIDEDLGNAEPLLRLRLPQQFITEGPNAGFWYFTDLPVDLGFNVAINTNALREGSIFWGNHPSMADRNLVIGTPVCTRRQLLTVVLEAVKKHEGFSRDDADSHVQSYTLEVERQARAIFEPVVRTSTDVRGFDAEFNAIDGAAQAHTREVTHSDAKNPMSLPCRLDFSVRGQRR